MSIEELRTQKEAEALEAALDELNAVTLDLETDDKPAEDEDGSAGADKKSPAQPTPKNDT